MKITTTKQFLSDLKKSRNISLRFDQHFPVLNFFGNDEREIQYKMELNKFSNQSGFWYGYTSDYQAIISYCKPGDTLNFSMYENGTENLKADGYRWVDLWCTISRHSKKYPDRLTANFKIKIDTIVAKKESTNFKDFDLHIFKSVV